MVEDRNGIPVLKALFDVMQFKSEEIHVKTEGGTLDIIAQHTEDNAAMSYTKTMKRKIEIPKQVIPELINAEVKNGLLKIEMPLGLPLRKKKPQGAHIYPITQEPTGKRKIQVPMFIGTQFTNDDVSVKCIGRHLYINASKVAGETDKYGQEMGQKDFQQEYILPQHHNVENTSFTLNEGELIVDIFLKDEKPFQCRVTVEDVPLGHEEPKPKFLF